VGGGQTKEMVGSLNLVTIATRVAGDSFIVVSQFNPTCIAVHFILNKENAQF
jgi:hypothetical protein